MLAFRPPLSSGEEQKEAPIAAGQAAASTAATPQVEAPAAPSFGEVLEDAKQLGHGPAQLYQ